MSSIILKLRRGGLGIAGLAFAITLLLGLASPAFATQSITSAGPLSDITITGDLNCAVRHTSDTQPEFYGSTACATLVASGGVLYGPANIPAGQGAAPRTPFTAVSQAAPTGAGSVADPLKVVTVVDLGASGLRLTQTDRYVVGQESYRTDVQVTNTTGSPQSVIVYRAGDCYLQSSDNGYGLVGPAPGAIACTTQPPPNTGGRIEQWLPITAGSHYLHGSYNEVWSFIGTQQSFPDTCRCTQFIDNGAGLSWNLDVAAGASATASSIITFSPTGVVPLTVSKTADSATAAAGSADGYTITIENPNAQAVVLNAVTDLLPPGFSYAAGSTSGLTSGDPAVSGQQLQWNGPLTVAASSSATLHFSVNVAPNTGTFFNNADADGGLLSVVPTGDTAPITVVAGPPAHLSLNPPAAVNVVDDEHCVTATVTDAYGNPVAGTTVVFGTSGLVSASGTGSSDAQGQAGFCFNSVLPGQVDISAFADVNHSGARNADEPSATAAKTYVVPPSTEGCKVTYGGQITARNNDKASFGGNAQALAGGAGPVSGQEEYQDHGPASSLNLHSVTVTSLRCSGDEASIWGTATIKGSGAHAFRIDLKDAGEPGRDDTYRIRISTGYDSGAQTLKSGNVQLH